MKHLFAPAVLLLTVALTATAQTEPIRIDLGQKGAVVSPNLYGIFFEEISHAGDGGLYAELVQNRGFEEHVLPSGMTYKDGKAFAPDAMNYEHRNNRNWNIPWNLEEKKMTGWRVTGEKATVSGEVIEAPDPLHKNTPHAMQLTIKKVQKGGKAVLTNTGYWGIGLKQGEKYDLRCYVRSAGYKGTITARLVDGTTGRSLGTTTFANKQLRDWTELTATLTADGTAAKGELALEFDKPGTVLVDYVSLFPQATFKGRKNGQRADVAQMLVDLHPRFMRWPGGCIVEGATYENRVKWKETLGDPMTRRGEWDLWGYRATWGMGYHEFLQFCEDLGMDAMFVNNAGMSCSVRNGDFVSSDADMDAVVQDFRDAIDYALADPARNKWAKMRAEAGHPRPFPLKYVEIGNENVGPEYVTHFNYIFKRLKAEYPQITFINTLGHTDRLLEQIPGQYMVDPHWYRDPNFFFANNHLFDDAPRTHDIYVGEYACNGGVGAGNLLAALSEAAFIMGMERNSDVVKMSSYAPLFENENRRDWPCNLIHINSSEVYGRASYYVQQMAAEHRPTYNVFVSETTTAGETAPFAVGTVGLGSYATQCEYRNVKVTTADGKSTSFSPAQFQKQRGEWTVSGDALAQTGNEQLTLSLLPSFSSNDYTLELQARKTGGSEGFFIYYGMDERGRNGYAVNIGGWNNRTSAIQPIRRGRTSDVLGRQVPQTVETGKWYDVKITVTPQLVTLFMDGKEILSAKPASQTRHFCQTGYDEQTGELVIKVVNGTEQPYRRSFAIDGATSVMPTGRVITLSGNAQDENTFDQPTKLAPQTTLYGKFGKQFSYEFAPMSFTIMRVKVEGLSASVQPTGQQERRRGFQRENYAAETPMVHDPVMARDGDTYYIYATGMGIQQMTSKDRKTWTVSRQPVMSVIPSWAADSVPGFGNHVWAPDVIQWHGQWWMAYSCSTFGKNGSAIGLLSSRSLRSNMWKDEGCIVTSHERKRDADGKWTGDNWNAIDPNFVIDDQDTPWLVWGSFWDGIQLARLDSTMHIAKGEVPRTIARRYDTSFKPTEPNPTSRFAGTNAIEAPFIFKHGGYYYLFVSWDYCCRGAKSNYRVAVGRSKNVSGPYLDRTGKDMANGGGTLFLEGDKKQWEAAGHCAAYTFDGEDVFVCHGYSATQNGAAMLIQRPISWTADGWPELK